MTPTQRTLRLLRDEYRFQLIGIVERFYHNKRIPHGVRSDLFNIFDILVSDKVGGIIGVQSCGTGFSSHYKKITQEYSRNASIWLHSGGRILLIGWRKIVAVKGSKRKIVSPRVKEIKLEDLQCDVAETATTAR